MVQETKVADRLRFLGKTVHEAHGLDGARELVRCMGLAIRPPFRCASGFLVDHLGSKSESFACLVEVRRSGADGGGLGHPADNVCAVVDFIESMGIEELRAAHARGLAVKRLDKVHQPDVGKSPVAVGTMTIIYAQRATVPVDVLAEELTRLNEGLEHADWIDVVAVSDVAVIAYGCQFAGMNSLGGLAPPAKGAKSRYSPAWYIIPTLQATGNGTFNKVVSLIAAYTVFFLPGTIVPDWREMEVDSCRTVITLPAYQYNLAGDLKPVPPEHYVGRLLPARPYIVEATQTKELLASLTYIPWQDGGVILLRGKLPLEGLMIFLGKDALSKGGVVQSGPESQDSYVLPITMLDFSEMMTRLRRQSNMSVRQVAPKYVMEKMADEGTTSPFIARILVGALQLRESVFPDAARRKEFDQSLDHALVPLVSARNASKEICRLWETHMNDVTSGKVVMVNGGVVQVSGDFHRALKKEVDTFLYDAAKALKEGLQKLGKQLNKDIGFLFKKDKAYRAGLNLLLSHDPLLAAYVELVRNNWSERLISARNELDHNGWTLPRTRYDIENPSRIFAIQPLLDGTPVVEFVQSTLDRLIIFTEEFLVHSFQAHMPDGADVAEIPLKLRSPQAPERFRLTLRNGGHPGWRLAYSTHGFEQT